MLPFLLEKDEGSVANESREGERGANESSKSFVAPVVPWNFLLVLLSVSLCLFRCLCCASLALRFARLPVLEELGDCVSLALRSGQRILGASLRRCVAAAEI